MVVIDECQLKHFVIRNLYQSLFLLQTLRIQISFILI